MPKDKGFFSPGMIVVSGEPPGAYPFRRGLHETMYRMDGGRPWTKRLFAGHGLAQDTNKIFKEQLAQGSDGLSTAFDLPTLMGRDSDDPLSEGQVGWDGVAIDTLADMEDLFADISIGEISVSMTINAPAAIIWAMFIAMALKRGVPLAKLSGTLQNDPLKEYIAQKEFRFPPEWAVKLTIDTIEYAAKHLLHWHPVSISGYHIREAGATPVEELAFTLSDGIEYVRETLARGVGFSGFGHRLSFFFDAEDDFVDGVSKLRAARELWARIVKEKFGINEPRLQHLKMHVQTPGHSLTLQEPLNNIVRVTIQAMEAVCGGAQSIHTNSYDEVLCTPTEEARLVALRTQQILLEEVGIRNYPDVFGGSYVIENRTNEMVAEAWERIEMIEAMGGMLRAVQAGYPQRAIRESANAHEHALRKGNIRVVGVNVNCSGVALEPKKVLEELEKRRGFEEGQIARLKRVRAQRDEVAVRKALEEIRVVAANPNENCIPALIEGASVYATLGEMCKALGDVWGEYRESDFFVPLQMPLCGDGECAKFRTARKRRILLAKGGLDGHDRVMYPVIEFLKSMGYEVIYSGLHSSLEEIACRAMEEDVHAVGLSTHIGSPVILFERLKKHLKRYGWNGILFGGGIIREHERAALAKMGIAFFASAGTPYEEIAKKLYASLAQAPRTALVSTKTRWGHLSLALTGVIEGAVGKDELARIKIFPKQAHVVGITGLFAAGKSTLIDQVISVMRGDGKTVAVLAIDPSEEESGGAFLGDAIRMRKHYADPGVFLRSISSRGEQGSLVKSLEVLAEVAARFVDCVIVETMGASQVDVALKNAVDTFVTLLPPGGDIINFTKEGFHRHAHILVVNVRSEQDERVAALVGNVLSSLPAREGWTPLFFKVNARTGEGVSPFVRNGIYGHQVFLRGKR